MFLVLGNVTVDEAMAAEVWPAAGQTIVVGPPVRDLGGKGANQAIVLARTGAAVRFASAIGRDAEGDWIAARLEDAGLDTAGLMRGAEPTDRSMIFVAPDGENAIASTVAAARSIGADTARAAIAGLDSGDGLLLQGNLTGTATLAALEHARARGIETTLNPSPMQKGFADTLPLVDLLVLNEIEGTQLGGTGAPETIAAELAARSGGLVVLTLGGRGAIVRGPSIGMSIPARTVPVVDTTGAGDTFTGVLVGAMQHHGLPIREAVIAASAAAALTVQRKGTLSAFPSRIEIEAILRGA